MSWILSKVCSAIWISAETLHIPLGKAAPYVFGGMIGRWPRKVGDQ